MTDRNGYDRSRKCAQYIKHDWLGRSSDWFNSKLIHRIVIIMIMMKLVEIHDHCTCNTLVTQFLLEVLFQWK